MQFERAVALARDTPTTVLCEAWGTSPDVVRGRKKGEHPMTLREAGALAELHGMKLVDVLAV